MSLVDNQLANLWSAEVVVLPLVGTLNNKLSEARLVIISRENMELLGTYYSFDEYKEFYEKNFAPLNISPELILDGEEEVIEQRYEDEYSPEELERMKQGEETSDDDGGEWY